MSGGLQCANRRGARDPFPFGSAKLFTILDGTSECFRRRSWWAMAAGDRVYGRLSSARNSPSVPGERFPGNCMLFVASNGPRRRVEDEGR